MGDLTYAYTLEWAGPVVVHTWLHLSVEASDNVAVANVTFTFLLDGRVAVDTVPSAGNVYEATFEIDFWAHYMNACGDSAQCLHPLTQDSWKGEETSSSSARLSSSMEAPYKTGGWGLHGVRYPSERLERALELLGRRGIVAGVPRPPPPLAPASKTRLKDNELRRLRAISHLSSEDGVRIAHSLGKSYMDLLAVRLGLPLEVTDAVVFPESEEEVQGVIEWAAEEGVALVPFGGGTSVLGGVRPIRGEHRAVVTVSLRRLNHVLSVNETSLLADAQAGIFGPELEAALQTKGLTLGHYPQSFHFSSLGGWIATRASGHLSGRYGRIEDMVQAVRLVTPRGEIETRSVPARSAGPDLKEVVLGSEGTLGIIVGAVLRVHRLPESKENRVALFPSFLGALDVTRGMLQAGVSPSLLRISDQQESAMILSLVGLEVEDSPAQVLLGFEGSQGEVESGLDQALNLWTTAGGVDMGPEVATSWEEEYYKSPYLRDDLMDRGLLVETLETSANWDVLPTLYEHVRDSLHRALQGQGLPGLVLCHLSHAYTDGGSLYFTVLAPRLQAKEVEQWEQLKIAATEAVLRGGTLSHHHGIGCDHVRWLRDEIGATGVEALRSLKQALDPQGIMNPGKLLEAGP